MKKKKNLQIVIICLLALILAFMGLSFALGSREDADGSGDILSTILSPVQKLFSSIGNGVGGFFNFIGDMKDFQQENVALKEDVNRLSQKLREAEIYKLENERLRQLLELKNNVSELDMVGCEVIAKDPGNWFDSFTIDKGSNAGIKKDAPVVSGEGLVGRVAEVGPNWARVVSIIDADCSVGALVSRTQAYAILDGELSLADRGQCRLTYITQSASLVVGDEIVTSGLGGVYPEGILIGTVAEIKSDSMGYSQYAMVDTAVDFERISEVMVIRNR